jgi:hypothetical protein
MTDPGSRYANVETATLVMADGTEVRYLKRRFLPDGLRQPLLTEVTVIQGDRLDLIAYRTIGDPVQFWRIADANNAMNPEDLVADAGEVIRVAVPQPDQVS